MPHATGKKEDGRARILSSAARAFRSRGYSGAGIDGLAKDAGVTSGAFYAHFASKDAAFEAAVLHGLQELRDGILAMRQQYGAQWPEAFIDFYLAKRGRDLAESCALQSLSGEVARAGEAVRTAYQDALQDAITAVADGLPDKTRNERREKATALLALLAGGVSMARAAAGEAFIKDLTRGIRKAALALLDATAPGKH